VKTADPDPEDYGSSAIIGLAVDGADGWYLGCITCQREIDEADSGMCQRCRQEAAFQEQQHLAGQEHS
jgi:rRNA maturation endonuclease Nob1